MSTRSAAAYVPQLSCRSDGTTHRAVARTEYHLRIARPRPQGSVDIGYVLIRAESGEDAITRAVGFMAQAGRSGWSGVAMLTDTQDRLIWSLRKA